MAAKCILDAERLDELNDNLNVFVNNNGDDLCQVPLNIIQESLLSGKIISDKQAYEDLASDQVGYLTDVQLLKTIETSLKEYCKDQINSAIGEALEAKY